MEPLDWTIIGVFVVGLIWICIVTNRMTKSVAADFVDHGVRVNAVAPGYTLTEMTKRGLGKSEWVDIWRDMTPMQRFAEPEEIAHAVLYLASDAASYVTGTVLLVDGGYSCW